METTARPELDQQSTHTFRDDAMGDLDGTDIARQIRSGELSATEVMDAAIARADSAGQLNALVVESFERARHSATRIKAGNRQKSAGAFAGVPTVIKDQIDLPGLPTKYGSEAHANAKPAKKTDPVAAQLFEMGLISLGKSTLPEFGFTPSTEFPNAEPTRNPWNLNRTAGGSSGGSAALVSAGVIPVAHAADGGGSIRIPASSCGLVGLKPTRGRIPDSAMAEPFIGIVVDGVVTRTVRDTVLYMVEAERTRPNPKLPSVGLDHKPIERSLRIGVLTKSPLGPEPDPATARELAASIKLLVDLGHTVEEIESPVGPEIGDDFLAFWSLLAGLVSLTSKRLVDSNFDRSRTTEFTKGLAQNARSKARQMPGAMSRLRKSSEGAAELFSDFDVLVSPTTGGLSPELGYLTSGQSFDDLFPKLMEWACYTPWANATGAPSLSLPLGFDDDTNLPVGICFNAGHGNERLLLELALQLEAAAPFRTIQSAP